VHDAQPDHHLAAHQNRDDSDDLHGTRAHGASLCTRPAKSIIRTG
jgi:hypothetical protein